MSGWWIHDYFHFAGPAFLVSWIFWVILSITLHELAHGWAAEWQGDRTPSLTGHMTIDPFVHIPGMGWILFAICGITWGLMPVDPSRFRSRYGDFLVSGAGPAMNFALAIVSMSILGLVLRFTAATVSDLENIFFDPAAITLPFYVNVIMTFFFVGSILNIVLGLFNLLPIPPLDGSRMLADVWDPARRWFSHPNAGLIGLVAMIVLVFNAGLFDWGYRLADRITIAAAGFIGP